jgi:hypothetical protein
MSFLQQPSLSGSFVQVSVRTAKVVHGFDALNKEVIEAVSEPHFQTKLVATHRVLSVSETYLLVTGSHGRVMYWEYEGGFEAFKQKLQALGLAVV